MTSWRRALVLGLLVWALPFAVAFAAFPLKKSHYPLFESIMAVAVAGCVVVSALSYFSRARQPTLREGLLLGTVWMAISIAIDLPLMLSPPMSYSIDLYFADVGLTYLMMPIVAAGIAHAASRRAEPTHAEEGRLTE